jgi:CRISPR-associated endonuclease/helicase Cas3
MLTIDPEPALNLKMKDIPTFFRYWGKADPNYGGEVKWHPFTYHSLDVAAVATLLWMASTTARRCFSSAFAAEAGDALRAWVLFFVALHDIGKLHALFQVKAPDALSELWPELDPNQLTRRPYDHGCNGYAQADEEIPQWIGSRQCTAVNGFASWLAAVMGHHGEICQPGDDKLVRGYAPSEIRALDSDARHGWIEQAAELFLVPAGVSVSDPPPR